MRAVVPVTLYTRRNCPLCEDAERVVEAFAARFPLRMELRDVDSRNDWRQSLGMQVPALFLDEQKLFTYRIDEPAFEAAILAYLGGADNGDHT